MIVHLRVVPGFWLAVEARIKPELLSQPSVIGGLPHQRGVVREASLPAQYRGVRVGMTLAQAQQQCPDAFFLVPDLLRYEAVWEEVCAILSRLTPLVEPLEMGQAVCDVPGYEAKNWNDPWQAAREIIARIRMETGITPWLGVASNRLVAQLASMQVDGEGITIIDRGRERVFLADLPITLLPDVDARLALTFQVLGLRTAGQLAALPRSAVRQRFGAAGERLHDYARGIDARPVISPAVKPAVSAQHECEDGTVEEALSLLHQLAESCAANLDRHHLAGTLITLTLTWAHSRLPALLQSQPGEHALLSGESVARSQREDVARPPARNVARSLRGREPRSLPIPYRIHSMLPQPTAERSHPLVPAGAGKTAPPYPMAHSSGLTAHSSQLTTHSSAIVRTPISTAPPLFERAQRLLLQLWPDNGAPHSLQAIELEISEFEAPRQLAFAELNRLDQVGALIGMEPGRRAILLQSEQALAARYGEKTPFRHLAQLDPAQLLTERRFRWADGLLQEKP